jgi:polyferredoxin
MKECRLTCPSTFNDKFLFKNFKLLNHTKSHIIVINQKRVYLIHQFVLLVVLLLWDDALHWKSLLHSITHSDLAIALFFLLVLFGTHLRCGMLRPVPS